MKKEEFVLLLKDADINKKEFAEIANIPYGTVNGWGVSRKGVILEIPNWVKPFLYYYKRSQHLEYLTVEICEKLTDKQDQ